MRRRLKPWFASTHLARPQSNTRVSPSLPFTPSSSRRSPRNERSSLVAEGFYVFPSHLLFYSFITVMPLEYSEATVCRSIFKQTSQITEGHPTSVLHHLSPIPHLAHRSTCKGKYTTVGQGFCGGSGMSEADLPAQRVRQPGQLRSVSLRDCKRPMSAYTQVSSIGLLKPTALLS